MIYLENNDLEKVIEKDQRKFDELRQAGYKIIEIWDYELKDKENIKNNIAKIFGFPLERNL